jgi:hypothetical protein
MPTDVLTLLTWTGLLFVGVAASAHLHQHLGILLASQATIMNSAALVDVLLLQRGVPSVFAEGAAVVAAGLMGWLHLPILLRTGASLLLIISAFSHIVLVEFWLAFPGLTGGSGGFLLPAGSSVPEALILFLALSSGACLYGWKWIFRPDRRFAWETIKTLGTRAGAFGVPAMAWYFRGLIWYGILLGAAGVLATRALGYLTVNSFGLTWS